MLLAPEKKVLRQGRWVTEFGESTLDSDLEAAQTKPLNGFQNKSELDEALEKAKLLQQKIKEKRAKLANTHN